MTFHAFTGTHSHELQIGKFVFQIRRRRIQPGIFADFKPRRFNAFVDPFGRWR